MPRPTERDIELVRTLSAELEREDPDLEPRFTDFERGFIPSVSRQVQRKNQALSDRQRATAERIYDRITSEAPSMELSDQ